MKTLIKSSLLSLLLSLFAAAAMATNPPHGECGHEYDPECEGCNQDCMQQELKE